MCCMCPAVLCTAAKASLPSHADTLQMERHAHSFVQLAPCEEIISVLPGMLKQRTPYRRSRPGAKSWRGRRGVPAGPRRTRPWRPAPWRRRRSMGLSSAASARCLAVQRRPRGATVAAAALRAATGREPKGHQCAAACSSSCCGGMRGGSSLAAHQHGTAQQCRLGLSFMLGIPRDCAGCGTCGDYMPNAAACQYCHASLHVLEVPITTACSSGLRMWTCIISSSISWLSVRTFSGVFQCLSMRMCHVTDP